MESRRSPWPGPRPLREEDGEAALLVGRERDLEEILRLLRISRFIHLTGRSGVGKTSLLSAGIVPQLRRMGYTVAMCRDWNRFADHSEGEFDVVLAQALHESLPEDQRGRIAASTDLYWDFHELKGAGVIILDQFEEFIRKEPDKRSAALDFLMALHANTSVVIVLSYRSEYVDNFESLSTDPRMGKQKSFRLGPIGAEAGDTLIKSPRRPADAGPGWTWEQEVSPEAADEIHQLWTEGCAARSLDHVAVGPLHLQALLYVLASEADPDPITKVDVDKFVADAREEGKSGADQIMGFALERSASTRLRRARQAALDASVQMDEFLIHGVLNLLARAVPMLSSGGFKVEQLTSDLAERCLEEESRPAAEQLGQFVLPSEDPIYALIEAVLGALTTGVFNENPVDGSYLIAADRVTVAAEADKWLNWGLEVWTPLLAQPDDDRHATSGPMMGLSPTAMLIEQLRRFAWALTWLYHLNLARVAESANEQARVTLVHDGFGQALQRWSDSHIERDGTWALYALATPEGESHRWGSPGGVDAADPRARRREERFQADISGDSSAGGIAVHANLGLRGNAVLFAKFHDVVFVNCDFRGTLFQGCTFDSVTFLNCRLDGTLFSDCVIRGSEACDEAEAQPIEALDDQPSAPFHELRTPPQYIVNATEAQRLAVLMRRYRGDSDAGEFLLSQPQGNPAIPANADAAGATFVPLADGLTIQGGRVSALTFRETRWEGGRLLFRRVRGSGVELAGLSGVGQVDFQRSLLRHVTFSQLRQDSCVLRVRVQDCAAAQWWVGRGFAGYLVAWRSHLAQLWIEPDDGFVPRLDESCDVSGIVVDGLQISAGSLGAEDVAKDLAVTDPTALDMFEASIPSMNYLRQAETLDLSELTG
jgi:hypothetical protein